MNTSQLRDAAVATQRLAFDPETSDKTSAEFVGLLDYLQ